MFSVTFNSIARTTAAMAFIVTLLALQTEQTEASCGDYLAHRSPTSDTTDDQPSQTTSDKKDSQQQSPCHGPNCSNAPSSPLVPSPAPTLTIQIEQWAQLASYDCDFQIDRFTRVTDSQFKLRNGHPRRVERPPQ